MLYHISLGIHIAAGTTAIILGSLALGWVRVNSKHKWQGKAFAFSLALVYLSATAMSISKGLTMLLFIAQLSGYYAAMGIRSIQLSRNGKKSNWDAALASIGGLVAIGMESFAVVKLSNNETVIGTISGVLGFVFLATAIKHIRSVVKPETTPHQWISNHVTGMTGAYISMVTAFCVTALNGIMPWYIAWFAPSIVFSILIARIARNYLSTKPLAI